MKGRRGRPTMNQNRRYLPSTNYLPGMPKYQDSFKKKVILYAEAKTTQDACRRYNVTETNIKRWMKMKAQIMESCNRAVRRSERVSHFYGPISDIPIIESQNQKLDSMPLQQRLSHSSTTSNEGQQPSTSQEMPTTLQSQTITPTKIKLTRQGLKSVPTPPPTPVVVEPPNEEVCLRWNSHHTNMQSTFPNILLREKYVDTTLVSEGKQKLKCHRMILSACSQYFEDILSDIGPLQHPVLCMKDIPYWILKALCDFMYAGEVHIRQNKLEELLKVAEMLQIKGLAGKPDTKEDVKPIKQEIKDTIKQEIKEPQPVVKLVKEPLLPFYSAAPKQKEAPAPPKEKTPVKESLPVLRHKSTPIGTRSAGHKEQGTSAPNLRQKEASSWKEVHVTRQKEALGVALRQKEARVPEKEEPAPVLKKPGPKSKTQAQPKVVEDPPAKVVPPSKIVPPKPAASKTTVKSGRQERGRSHSYTEKQKELKVPLTKGNINDPLDLLEPVYEVIQKQPPPPPKIVAKIPLPVPSKKGPGPRSKVKKRKAAEEETPEESTTFPSRKGTRSRPNVKIPRFFDPSFEQPDATIVREPHTNQTEPLSSTTSDQATPTDPFQSIEMEEIKVEPAEMEESNLMDARGNIVSYMEQQEGEEEIIGSYDSPIVNIKKEVSAPSSSALLNVTTVTDGHTTSNIDINKDRLKVVDISKIQRGKSNVDQLVHTPVNNPGIKISNVQTVPEELPVANPTSSEIVPNIEPEPIFEPPQPILEPPQPILEPPQPVIATPQPVIEQPPPLQPQQPIIQEPQPTVEPPQVEAPQPTPPPPRKPSQPHKKKKNIVMNPLAMRIKEERIDPDFLPSTSTPPTVNQVYIKPEPQDDCEEDFVASRTPIPNQDQIMEIIGVSRTIKKEIIEEPDSQEGNTTPDTSQKQENPKQFRKIKLYDPRKSLQEAMSKRLLETMRKSLEKSNTSTETTKVSQAFTSVPIKTEIVDEPERSLDDQPASEDSFDSSVNNDAIPSSSVEVTEKVQENVDNNTAQVEKELANIKETDQAIESHNIQADTVKTENLEPTQNSTEFETTEPENEENTTQEMLSLESLPSKENESQQNNTQEMYSLESTTERIESTTQEMANVDNSIPEPNIQDNTIQTSQPEYTHPPVEFGPHQENVEYPGVPSSSAEIENLESQPNQSQTDGNTQDMYSVGEAEKTQEFDNEPYEPGAASEQGYNEEEEQYQNYTGDDNYDQGMDNYQQETDFTKDDFGQDNNYGHIQNTQEMVSLPDSQTYPDDENIEQNDRSSEIDSAVANIPNYDEPTDYSAQNQEYDNFDSRQENENYDDFKSVYESEAPSDMQPKSDSLPNEQQNLCSTDQMDTGICSQPSLEAVDTALTSQEASETLMTEDMMLDGAEESKRMDETLDESLLEDFEDDVEMRDAPSVNQQRGPSPEKTLEMIVNDLNESLGDVRHPGTDNAL